MDKRIKVFTTPGCDNCNQARKFLSDQGVEFDYIDVTEDGQALLEMKSLARGARTAPIISVCDKVLVGFNKAELEKAISCL
ncbi:MAG: glutaredoxin family protein [Syntrophobacteraceae bacterium]